VLVGGVQRLPPEAIVASSLSVCCHHLAGIAVALMFAAALIYAPTLQGFFGTAGLGPGQLATVAPFPFIV
jgi:hypothetical protein